MFYENLRITLKNMRLKLIHINAPEFKKKI
jgi:hypothetical protein